jgi:REP element-mobilizing transposase RayT
MNFLHKGAQRRIRIPDAAYFITVKTQGNNPFFRESVFCDLFVENLRLCKRLKKFELYGWFLGYDHFHLMIRPMGKWSYSEIMFSIKKQFSHDANRMIGFNPPYPEGAQTFALLQGELENHQKTVARFRETYAHAHPISEQHQKFHWQKSYLDHYCRDERDFRTHLEYIAHNPIKHELPRDWPYIFTNSDYADLADDCGLN